MDKGGNMPEEKKVKIRQSTQVFIDLEFGNLLTSERAILKALMQDEETEFKMFISPVIDSEEKEINRNGVLETVWTLKFDSVLSEKEVEDALVYLKGELARLSQLDNDLGILFAAETEWDVARPSRKKK
jgi:hypothetical protein